MSEDEQPDETITVSREALRKFVLNYPPSGMGHEDCEEVIWIPAARNGAVSLLELVTSMTVHDCPGKTHSLIKELLRWRELQPSNSDVPRLINVAVAAVGKQIEEDKKKGGADDYRITAQ